MTRAYEYQSVGIRLEGDIDKINGVLRRLKLACHLNDESRPYPNKRSPYGVRVYARAYPYNDRPSLGDQLINAEEELERLAEALINADNKITEQQNQIDRLKQELGRLPKPGPYDAVLSPKHSYHPSTKTVAILPPKQNVAIGL